MPTPEQILSGPAEIANNWQWLAIVWHVYFAAIAVTLLIGVRPSRRLTGVLLALPLFSVSILAWTVTNPFNGILIALAATALAVIAVRLPEEPVEIARTWIVTSGVALFLFGWIYPHFLETASFLPYLYAAPTGLIPCPTLSIIIGTALLTGGLRSRIWSLLLGSIGLFYGLFGFFRLGVTIDAVLFVGALLLLWVAFRVPRDAGGRERAVRTPHESAATASMVGRFDDPSRSASTTGIGRLLLLAVTLTVIVSVFLLVVRPWYIHWGATTEEISRALPGDEIVAHADAVETRAITIDAGVEEMWPWVAQLGQDRGGFYTFDLLENIVGCEMPTGDDLLPEKQSWKIGDRLWMYPPEKAGGIDYATLESHIPGRAHG